MALKAYLKLVGQKQGEIRGSETTKGREGQIAVIAASHEISTPFDKTSGLPAGGRLHTPFIIAKELDASSPLMYRVLVGNENISKWELRFWDMDANGTEFQRYTVRLTNANIRDIKFCLPNVVDPATARQHEYGEIAFVYQKIEWAWVVGDDIIAEDDWESRG